MADPQHPAPESGSTLDPQRIYVSFLKSAPDIRQCPSDLTPEVAFAGRSNAGKSSVLNRLTGNRGTAKVSKTPGRTQLLNLFDVRGGGRLVDLPGYGYAKAERNAQAKWQGEVNRYLEQRTNLVGLVLVMDIRHALQPLDLELIRWSEAAQMPLLLLLNKSDKLGFGAQQQALQAARARLRARNAQWLTFSALRGQHVEDAIAVIRGWLGAGLPDTPAG
ncbi:MAG: ribosome biogenesis GTP-binding protein YihA/YsxC [Gammaproteobacteria bacterium]